jgi:predicted DNA-binding protein
MRIKRTPKEKANRVKRVTFRMTDEMTNQIKELAKKSNLTISEYVRNILNESV